ncbi:hypothetical protein D5S18_00635 [Nocardia panacis]|uniref:SnoaL-like domain-containing protein n=1 Tax=Nocardia panacis TaxID=2340916 RepID=A0A3A4KTF6_9NOCA|nr:nuclear transport factor 2 family protein [Nocardia panacis]RJO79817.1 hypothetical protein D5S18_00635 [Nocardia panacis]
MPPEPTAAALAAVLASPRAVAAHDRAGWVALFTAEAVVNDPVGSRPHLGTAVIARFYDTFIAPNTIEFRVDHDIACPTTVFRDLTIETTMSTGAMVAVPMHLKYDVVQRDGAWRIAELAAHWELGPMIWQLLRTGAPGLLAATRLGPQLLRHQGLDGALAFLRALISVGRTGKRRTARMFAAAATTDIATLRILLGDHATLELPAGHRVTLEEFTNRTRNMRWDKLIAAGRSVTATVWIGTERGIAVIDFAAGTARVTTVRVYLDHAS